LSGDTLYGYAGKHPRARQFTGRGTAYAIPLPHSRTRVVVRHNRHGGAFAALTGDRFFSPRAPYELEIALRLASAGVATTDIIGYALYAAGPLFRRSDVVTREIEGGRDLALVLTEGDDAERCAALDATARLIGQLSAAGARHHDLNVKNVLLRGAAPEIDALVLDVDRVTFETPSAAVAERNVERFTRSARKWRTLYGARVTEPELAALAATAREIAAGVAPAPDSARR
jgi:3-deoxy-D-manno-octulosonic acid kinase